MPLLIQMEALHGKTPISYLQELCTKQGITPQYNLVANEGAIHEPTFLFRASAGQDYLGTGKGSNTRGNLFLINLYLADSSNFSSSKNSLTF